MYNAIFGGMCNKHYPFKKTVIIIKTKHVTTNSVNTGKKNSRPMKLIT